MSGASLAHACGSQVSLLPHLRTAAQAGNHEMIERMGRAVLEHMTLDKARESIVKALMEDALTSQTSAWQFEPVIQQLTKWEADDEAALLKSFESRHPELFRKNDTA